MARPRPRTPGPIPQPGRYEPDKTPRPAVGDTVEARAEIDAYPCERIQDDDYWGQEPEPGNVSAALREGSLPHKAWKRATLEPTALHPYITKRDSRNGGPGWVSTAPPKHEEE
jgi:hypothetical protein